MTSVLGPYGELPEGADKERAVEAMFDRVAPRYDRLNRLISLGMDRRWRRRTAEALGLPAGSRVLDLACGTGDLCRDLQAAGLRAIGVDFSEGMLSAAHTSAPLVRADATNLPVPSASVDGVVCGFALRNFVDLHAFLDEAGRVVRPGGRIALLDADVPTSRVLRAGHHVWFRGAVPLIGRLVASDREAYQYLPRSTAYLPPRAALLGMARAAGFPDAAHQALTGGAVQLITGTRA